MNPIVTFVVCAYNVEQFLDECLSSLADKKFEDIVEVLVVNDGSTDGTDLVASRYAEDYPYIRVIRKKNGGQGSVFNIGIKEAKGKYWISIDGDDAVNKSELEFLCSILREKDYDAVFFPKEIFGSIQKREKIALPAGELMLFDKVACRTPYFIHNIAFKTSLLKDITVEETERLYADGPLVLYAIPHIKTCLYVDAHVYRYRYSAEQSISINGMRKNERDLLNSTRNMVLFYKKQTCSGGGMS